MKSYVRKTWIRSLELLAIALSFLERNSIARFLAAKFGLDFVVEVTARFGRNAGHRLSTFIALLVAQPELIAVLVTGIIIAANLIAWIISGIRASRRRSPHMKETMKDQ